MSLTPSNSFTFQMTIEEMIREAAQSVGGGTLDGEQLQSYVNSFNIIQQDMVNKGYPLSLLLQSTLNVCENVIDYELNRQIYDIHNAVIREENDTTDVSMDRISLAEYNELPNKSTTGRPTTFAVERLYDKIKVRVWPTPDQAYCIFMYVFTKPDDLRKYTDTVRMSPRLYPAMIAGLSYQIAMKRNEPLEKIQFLKLAYDECLRHAYHEDRERVSFFITPASYGGRG